MNTEQNNIPKLRFPEFDEEWNKQSLAEYIERLDSGVSVNSIDKQISEKDIGILKTSSVFNGKFYPSENKTIIAEEEYRAKLNPTKDSLIISRMNTPQLVGEIGYVEKDYPNLFIPDRLWITKTNKKINVKWLSFALTTPKSKYKISNLGTGTSGSMKNISKPNFLGLNIETTTLPEQQKIAQFLSSVDTKIEQLTQKKQLLEQYKKGVMQQIFPSGDGQVAQLRFKKEDGSDYSDWEVKELGEVAEIITGKTPSTSNKNLWGGNIQFITPTDIVDGNKYQNSTQRTVCDTGRLNILPKGSIVYTCIASIGKMALSVNPCITNQQINSLIPKNNFDNEFIYYALLEITPKIKSTQSTTTLPIINKTEFSKIRIVVPCLEEQTQIANFLSAIDEKIDFANTQINITQAFKKGLLQQMFV